jgi:hypothetical protein
MLHPEQGELHRVAGTIVHTGPTRRDPYDLRWERGKDLAGQAGAGAGGRGTDANSDSVNQRGRARRTPSGP